MGSPYVGEIRMFAGNFAPANWMFCDGALLPISEYDVLYTLIGTTYGGDGVTTFALPDLRSRVPVHQGPDSFGNNYIIGQSGGAENVTLTTQQMPAHTHPVAVVSGPGTANTPQNNFFANWPGAQYSDQGANTTLNAGALQNAGNNLPHDNMLPFQAVNFIISLFGIYPSQS
jgi:microcystin-dependent protein